MSELQELTGKIEKLLDSKKSVAPTHFWAGIGLTIISMVAIGGITFGSLSTDVESNTDARKDNAKHTTAETLKSHADIMELKLDGVKDDLKTTSKRVDKLEKKYD